MFIILVMPSNAGTAVSLFYKTKEAADIAQKNIHECQKGAVDAPICVARDDFGHILTIARSNIVYAVLIDHAQAALLGPPPGMQGVRPASRPRVAPDVELTEAENAA